MKKEIKAKLKAAGLKEMPKILFASAECAPFSKTGGLADVVGTLPKALKKLDAEAAVITPFHSVIKKKYAGAVEHLCDFRIMLGWRDAYVGIERYVSDGITFYFVDNEDYFGDRIYRGGGAEGEQYSFFCRAVLEALPRLDFTPDVLHCNDWHTAMMPMLAKTQYKGQMQEKLKFLLTIHNIAFQGRFGYDYIRDLLDVAPEYYTPDGLEMNGCGNYLKAGCVFSDKINTVSPNYAEEIKGAYFGEGLEGILNARNADLSGIINGIDRDVFNPGTDRSIPAHFSAGRLKGKAACKAELQKSMGLEQRPEVPLFAMVTRMTEQKGFDLVSAIIDRIMQENDIQFMLLGTGDGRFEDVMRKAEERYKGRLCAYIGYSEPLSHLVYAGSDFFLMPSRFEPCGLSQMIAMRYGSIPIVRETGGLKDTVIPYNKFTGEGDGFSFANYDAGELYDSVLRAIDCYGNEEIMRGLIHAAMTKDFSFDASAEKYAELYLDMFCAK